jgi:poly(3-hydroxybutyrate) depolymerase
MRNDKNFPATAEGRVMDPVQGAKLTAARGGRTLSDSVQLTMKLNNLLRIIAVALFVVLAEFAIASSAAGQVADSTVLKSNDAQLYLELRGQAERSPILLYLHGGPGNAFGLISFRAYVGPQLESRFLVAYLHQRGVASSPAVPDSTQTVANHIADVKNVVAYIRTRFPGRHIYLLGHSWGGTLAVLSCAQNPGLVDGVIDVAGLSTSRLTSRRALQ